MSIRDDPELADVLDYPYAGWCDVSGKAVGVMDLIGRRGRIWRGSEVSVEEFW